VRRPDPGTFEVQRAFHIHRDELAEFVKDLPAVPMLLPWMHNDWPKTAYVDCRLSQLGGKPVMVIFNGEHPVSGEEIRALWLDLAQADEAPDVRPEHFQGPGKSLEKIAQWRHQFGLLLGTYPTAFYATRGGGIDFIVQAPSVPADESTEVRPDIL